MRYVSHRGMGPLAARSENTDPVFPLTRKAPLRAPFLVKGRSSADSLPSASDWPFDREPESGIYEIIDEEPPPRPATAREIAVRIVGSLVLAATLYGCGAVLLHPSARREALQWATFGHEDRALDAVRSVSSLGDGR